MRFASRLTRGRTARVAAASVLATAAVIVATTSAGVAGDLVESMTVTPTSVTPPFTVTITGTGCGFFQFESPGDISGSIFGPLPSEKPVASFEATAEGFDGEFGNWTTTATIPEGTPAGDYSVDALCFLDFGPAEAAPAGEGDPEFSYPAATLTVLAPPPPPPPPGDPAEPPDLVANPAPVKDPTTAPPARPEFTPPDEVLPARVARPVRAQPSFTG